MYFALGFIEMNISEFFCNGTPFGIHGQRPARVHGPAARTRTASRSRWRASIRRLALVANVAASDAFGTRSRTRCWSPRPRILVDLGQFARGGGAGDRRPDELAYNLTFSTTAGDNGPYTTERQSEHRRATS